MMSMKTRTGILLLICLLVMFQQIVRVDLTELDARYAFDQRIVAGVEQAPFVQRVFTVWLANAFASVAPGNYAVNVLTAHAVIGALALTGFLLGCDAFFRRLFTADRALLGVALVALTFNLTVSYYTPVPHYSWVEAACFVWGLVCIYDISRWRQLSSSARSTATP